MKRMRGIITIAQESRFQLTDEAGAGHLFLLSPKAAAEPQQLVPLMKAQAWVDVRYVEPRNIVGLVAHGIRIAPERSWWRRALTPWK